MLDEPYHIGSATKRETFERMLQELSRQLGSDATHDVSRLLRLPGFLNVKDARMGNPPVPCTLLECHARRRFSQAVFEPYRRAVAENDARRSSGRPPLPRAMSRAEAARVRELVEQLGLPARDRSRRDFAVVCELLRLGLADEQIWRLVQGTSKFQSNGRSYFETTLQNAVRELTARP